MGDPYAQWKGGAFVPIGTSWTPTPQWRDPLPFYAEGPYSGWPEPPQMDLGWYVSPAIPRSVGPVVWLTETVRDGSGQQTYSEVFALASAPAIPTSGPTLLSSGQWYLG